MKDELMTKQSEIIQQAKALSNKNKGVMTGSTKTRVSNKNKGVRSALLTK